MCADWQGTRLAVNQQMPSLTVITEAGAAAQTPFPYSILGSEIRLQNRNHAKFYVRLKVYRAWGHEATQRERKTILQIFSEKNGALTQTEIPKITLKLEISPPKVRELFPLAKFSKINFNF